MDLEIKLPLTSREAKVLFGVLDKYTDENYNTEARKDLQSSSTPQIEKPPRSA